MRLDQKSKPRAQKRGVCFALALAPLCAVLFFTEAARAQARPAFAPPGKGQPGLAVGVDSKGVLRAKICAASPCTVEAGVDLAVPAELKGELARAQLAVVGIGAGRRAIVVTVPGGAVGQAYQAVIVAPIGGQTPRVVFSGLTGLVEGADGVRQGRTVTIFEPDETGARGVVIGTEREDLDLCGRRAVLGPEFLNPADLSLRAAKVQRLLPAEREQAARLLAVRAPNDAAPPGRVLSALGATSAIGAPQMLTDGRPDTTWSENRGGGGRGEFVVMSAPQDLPISGFELVLTAPESKPDPANVPRELWLVTRSRVYHVTFPEEASTEAGARFRVTLPKPDQTDCVAQVLESPFAERAESRVTVAELSVTSEFEGATPEALVGALAGGGERALGAGAVLRGLGAPGFAELGKRFASLDEQGRRVALSVIDSAPCKVSVPVYLTAFASNVEAHQLHAQARLRRCGSVSADGLSAGIQTAKGRLLTRFANELTLVAPGRAISELSNVLSRGKASERRILRVALGRAIASPDAQKAVREKLADVNLHPMATLDLLRALGERAPEFLPEAGAALARLRADASFRTRYLLLGPAAVLAERDGGAREFLESALLPQAGADTWIRMRAVELAPREPARAPAFIAALSDENVRVREAAAQAIGEGRLSAGGVHLIQVLEDDEWPIARRAAALGLGALPPEAPGDKALEEALSDEAFTVRAASAESLGTRGVKRAAPELLERLEDPRERFEVRRAAAAALGALCDNDSTDTLWKLVRRIDDPLATVEERAIGEASLAALVRIGPKDLEEGLERLRKGKGRTAVERAVRRGAAGRCVSGGR